MAILFLDDSKERQRGFARTFPYADFVATAAEAIKALTDNIYDVVCLDHDLGDEIFVESDRKDCGMEVVRWMVLNKPNVRVVVVHTHNPPAAINMVSCLAAHYEVLRIPFMQLLCQESIDQLEQYHGKRDAG